MSSRRNFRRRGGDSDPEDPPNPTPTPQPKPAVKTKKPSLLSFADDEAEEDSPSPLPKIPPLSKPSSNHKLSSSKHRLPPSKPSNVQPQAGTYTKEALLELQKNTRTLAAPNPKPKPKPEPTIVLKGLIKPQPNPLIKPDRPDRVVRNDLEEEDGGVIPDQATIDAIRAKRERMRQGRGVGGGGGGGMGGDYIALDMGSNHGEAEGLSDEEPEMRARIGFLGGEVEEEGGKKGVFEEVEEREKVNSDGEEDRMWEEVQVRKGLGKRIEEAGVGGGSNVAHPTAGAAMYSSLPGVSVSASDGGGTNIGGGVGGLPGVDFMTIGQEAEIAKKALHENLARLRVSDFQPTSV